MQWLSEFYFSCFTLLGVSWQRGPLTGKSWSKKISTSKCVSENVLLFPLVWWKGQRDRRLPRARTIGWWWCGRRATRDDSSSSTHPTSHSSIQTCASVTNMSIRLRGAQFGISISIGSWHVEYSDNQGCSIGDNIFYFQETNDIILVTTDSSHKGGWGISMLVNRDDPFLW